MDACAIATVSAYIGSVIAFGGESNDSINFALQHQLSYECKMIKKCQSKNRKIKENPKRNKRTQMNFSSHFLINSSSSSMTMDCVGVCTIWCWADNLQIRPRMTLISKNPLHMQQDDDNYSNTHKQKHMQIPLN